MSAQTAIILIALGLLAFTAVVFAFAALVVTRAVRRRRRSRETGPADSSGGDGSPSLPASLSSPEGAPTSQPEGDGGSSGRGGSSRSWSGSDGGSSDDGGGGGDSGGGGGGD